MDSENFGALMRRWFVQYNPLYLASAAMVLCGVVLISSDPGPGDNNILWLVLELYQVGLITAVFALMKRGQRRPAVILALIASVFLIDPTFRTEHAAVSRPYVWLIVAWFVVKVAALAHAMKIVRSARLFLYWSMLALLLAVGPRLDVSELESAVPFLLIVACAACRVALGGAIHSRVALDEWGQCVLRRAETAVWTMWGVGLLIHATAWTSASTMIAPGLAIALIAALHVHREKWMWIGVVLALCIAACGGSAMLNYFLIAAASVVYAFGRRSARARVLRLAVATGGPYRENVMTEWHERAAGDVPRRFVFGAAACLALLMRSFIPLPASLYEAGRWLVVGGFLSLPAGVAISLVSSSTRRAVLRAITFDRFDRGVGESRRLAKDNVAQSL